MAARALLTPGSTCTWAWGRLHAGGARLEAPGKSDAELAAYSVDLVRERSSCVKAASTAAAWGCARLMRGWGALQARREPVLRYKEDQARR